jgi:hypothetical protein
MKTFKEYLVEAEQPDTAFNDTSALMPAKLDQDTMDAMEKGVRDGIKQLPPDQQAAAEQFIVRDADGDVDGDETMMKMFEGLAGFGAQIYDIFAELTAKMEAMIKTPEFAQQYPDPAEQQKIIKDVADIRAELPKLKAAADQAKAEWSKIQPQMRQAIDQRANDKFKAKTGLDMVRTGTGAKTNIGTDPNNPGGPGVKGAFTGESAELSRWLKIAGLR